MLVAPFHWYADIPGVTETGPANAHLIRDVGCAFLVTALALLWFAVAPMRAWPAVLAGGAFLFSHASVHVWDTLWPRAPSSSSGRNPYDHLTGLTHPLARVAAKSYFQRGVRIARLKRQPNKKTAPVSESRLSFLNFCPATLGRPVQAVRLPGRISFVVPGTHPPKRRILTASRFVASTTRPTGNLPSKLCLSNTIPCGSSFNAFARF